MRIRIPNEYQDMLIKASTEQNTTPTLIIIKLLEDAHREAQEKENEQSK